MISNSSDGPTVPPGHTARSSSDKLLTNPIEITPPDGVHLEPWSFRKLTRLMSFFGPAAIAASVSIGAGETLISVVTGAWARYQLLWLVLLACVCKGFITTYLLGRYTAISGEYFGHRIARMPGPRGWLPLVLLAIELSVAGLICVVISKPCGNLLAFLLHDYLPGAREMGGARDLEWGTLWETRLAVAFAVLAVGMSLRMSYQRLEKQNLIICGILVCGTVVACALVQPDFGAAVRGTTIPKFPQTPWTVLDLDTGQRVPSPSSAGSYGFAYLLLMVTVFGYVGNTVIGYVVYSNWVGIRGWGLTSHPDIDTIRRHLAGGGDFDYLPRDSQSVAQIRTRASPLCWDASMGAIVLFLVSASFMMAGAQVIYPRVPTNGLPEWKALLTEQRHVWREVHPWLVPVYYGCVLSALWGTLNALPEIWSRVTHEFLAAIDPRAERWPYRYVQRGVAAIVLAPCLFLIVTGAELQLMAAIVATFTTNLAVAVVCGIAVYLNWTLPAPYRPHRLVLIGGVVATAVLGTAALGGLAGLARELVT